LLSAATHPTRSRWSAPHQMHWKSSKSCGSGSGRQWCALDHLATGLLSASSLVCFQSWNETQSTGTIQLYGQNESGAWEEAGTLEKHRLGIKAIAWLSDSILFSSGDDQEIKRWSVLSMSPTGRALSIGSVATCLSAHPSSSRVISGHSNGVVNVWTHDLDLLHTITVHTFAVSSLAATPTTLLTCGERIVTCWSMHSSVPVHVWSYECEASAQSVSVDDLHAFVGVFGSRAVSIDLSTGLMVSLFSKSEGSITLAVSRQ
jgi:hypothetical protein